MGVGNGFRKRIVAKVGETFCNSGGFDFVYKEHVKHLGHRIMMACKKELDAAGKKAVIGMERLARIKESGIHESAKIKANAAMVNTVESAGMLWEGSGGRQLDQLYSGYVELLFEG